MIFHIAISGLVVKGNSNAMPRDGSLSTILRLSKKDDAERTASALAAGATARLHRLPCVPPASRSGSGLFNRFDAGREVGILLAYNGVRFLDELPEFSGIM
jgi:predicted ATPase with chaperone activity